MFWTMFEKFTQEERSKYLKFVWGRSKLPSNLEDLTYKHEVHVYDHLGAEALPEAHTCFFTLDLPPYENIEIMTSKMKTAIELCGEIDADYDPDNIQAADGGENNNDDEGHDDDEGRDGEEGNSED